MVLPQCYGNTILTQQKHCFNLKCNPQILIGYWLSINELILRYVCISVHDFLFFVYICQHALNRFYANESTLWTLVYHINSRLIVGRKWINAEEFTILVANPFSHQKLIPLKPLFLKNP